MTTNQQCLEIATNSIRNCNDYYEISFPWRKEAEELPNSYPVAMKRFKILEAKLIIIKL